MNAAAVVELICPGTPVVSGEREEYDIPSRRVFLIHPAGTRLTDLMGAAHEAYHALRHRQGYTFYATRRRLDSVIAWNEEGVEEEHVTAAAEEWMLSHCRHLYTERGIRREARVIREGAIAPDEGYVSRYVSQPCPILIRL